MIEQFIDTIKHKKSPNTIKSYEQDLAKLESYISKHNVDIDSLNDLIVQQFIHQLEKEYSPSTVNRIFASVRTFCNWSNQSHAVKDIDIQKVKHISKQEAKGLNEQEWQSIRLSIANNKTSSTKERDLAIFDFLLFSGCRVSEVASINREDITYTNGTYTVFIRESKSNESRYVYFNAKQFKYIKRYLDNREDQNEALFISKRGRISVRMIQTMLNEYNVHPHLLRHTFCSTLARKNIDLVTIASLAGHRDINTTRRYTNPTAKEMAEAVSKAFS
ncbi:tyrosine-type recombinase/integrase [Halalkalibacter sp. APA_J-10(15)]|uniref:tyrosine-type recombinase/integrase n=1 Tax=Halalkalibacter sp. APA_J-10(15) TaxID=2933805 RepID=UPI001FF1C025|nr:tyrosine-type recombinase/integrase [Halalkalibacter sp. APA_J-10(15)]MCK0470880.1 tyrosine-type recombinase/integrase [Halalkalibacter sp. APA_J-10(15)]